MPSLLIAGPTGLIGSTVLQQALADPRFTRVEVLSRRGLPRVHPRLVEHVHADLLPALPGNGVDAVICCLGTTISKVGGDRARFIHVDLELVVELGKWARDHSVRSMSVVSAVGANSRSRFFYSRVKGNMEEALRGLGLPALHIFQPSVLMGPRQELRVGERIGIAVMRMLGPLVPCPYRPMQHDVLARALLRSSLCPGHGVHTHTHAGIHRLADQNTTD